MLSDPTRNPFQSLQPRLSELTPAQVKSARRQGNSGAGSQSKSVSSSSLSRELELSPVVFSHHYTMLWIGGVGETETGHDESGQGDSKASLSLNDVGSSGNSGVCMNTSTKQIQGGKKKSKRKGKRR